MITTAVPAIVYTTALFSDAHVLTRSHSEDDDDDAEDEALIEIGPSDMVQHTRGQFGKGN